MKTSSLLTSATPIPFHCKEQKDGTMKALNTRNKNILTIFFLVVSIAQKINEIQVRSADSSVLPDLYSHLLELEGQTNRRLIVYS